MVDLGLGLVDGGDIPGLIDEAEIAFGRDPRLVLCIIVYCLAWLGAFRRGDSVEIVSRCNRGEGQPPKRGNRP